MADNNEYLKRAEKLMKIEERRRDLGKELRKGTAAQLGATKDLIEAKIREERKLSNEIKNIQDEITELQKEGTKEAKEKIAVLEAQLEVTKKVHSELKVASQTLNLKNTFVNLGRSLFNIVKGVLSKALSITQSILNTAKSLTLEYMEQDSAIRRLNINIGAVGKANDRLRKTFNRSAMVTQRWGMSAKELAETYASFADETGRLVSLSESAAEAMAKMAMGTGLGKDGAVQMANSMDSFGVSIKGTAKFVEDVSKTANKLGINSGKVLKSLATNMKKMQTIRFKNGLKGMKSMAMLATRLKNDMSSTLRLAEDLWEPEKAIETAAQLQMMGGEFAKMGDPMQLMMKGRNDPEALMKDMASAAAAQFSGRGSMGELLMPTVERQRLKQVAESLGMSFEELYEMAANERNHGDVMGLLPKKMSKEQREMISNMAQFDPDKGGFTITLPSGQEKLIKNLTQSELMKFADVQQDMAKNAEAAQSTWERIQNWWKSVKYLFNEFLMGMDDVLRPLIEQLFGSGGGEGLKEWGTKFRKWGEQFGKFIQTTLWPGIQKLVAWGKQFLSFSVNAFESKGLWGGLESIWEKQIKPGLETIMNSSVGQWIKSGLDGVITTLKWGFGALIAAYLGSKVLGGAASQFGRNMMPGGRGSGGSSWWGGRSRSGKPGQNFKQMRKNAGYTRGKTGQMKQSRFAKFKNTKVGKGLGFMGKAGKGLGKVLGPLGIAMTAMDAYGNFSEGNYGSGIADVVEGGLYAVNPFLGLAASGIRSMAEDEIGKTGLHWKSPSEWSAGGGPFGYGGGFDMADANISYGMGGSTPTSMMLDGVSTSDGHTIVTPKGEIYKTHGMDYLIGQPEGGTPAGGGVKEVKINGSLMIKGDGFQREMLNDRIFMEEFSRTVSKLMNDQIT
jgi:hypothetical protein